MQVNPQMAYNHLTVVPGVLMLSFGFHRHQAHRCSTDTQAGKISIYIIFKNHIYLVCAWCMWHDASEEVRRQLVELSSLLPCGFWGIKLGLGNKYFYPLSHLVSQSLLFFLSVGESRDLLKLSTTPSPQAITFPSLYHFI